MTCLLTSLDMETPKYYVNAVNFRVVVTQDELIDFLYNESKEKLWIKN